MADSSASEPSYPLKGILRPHPHDVLCGRGGGTNNHVGNSHWRMLVAANKQLYVTLPKRQKMLLSKSIVNAVRSQNPPGRFLQKDAKSNLWSDVGDQRAQEKTSQALREGAPDIRSKLSHAPSVESTDENTKNLVSDSKPPAKDHSGQGAGAPSSTNPDSISSHKHNAQNSGSNNNNNNNNNNAQNNHGNGNDFQQPQPQPHTGGPIMPPPTAVQQQTSGFGPVAMPAQVNGLPSPPPGATPMVVYAMPQGMQAMQSMPGVEMYPAMMTAEGMMMQNMGNAQNFSSPFPAPMSAQLLDQQKQNGTNGGNGTGGSFNNPQQTGLKAPDSASMPPPSTVLLAAESATTLTSSNITKMGPAQARAPGQSQPSETNNAGGETESAFDEGADMVSGGLEPSGVSFGTISMASIDTRKLETGGTSFGSMMSFTVASSRAPDMVDGGLEPIGTSFGSLSLNSTDRGHLQSALGTTNMAKPDLPKTVTDTYHTPTLLAQQRSTGNLLECSESEDEEDDYPPNQTSQSADWEKLKAMLHAQSNMENRMQPTPEAIPVAHPPPQPTALDSLPHTGFDRDFSNISAISMGEFDHLEHVPEAGEPGKEDMNGNHQFGNGIRDIPKHVTGGQQQEEEEQDEDIPVPPPSLPLNTLNDDDDDDDGPSDRERLQMMYLANGGGANL